MLIGKKDQKTGRFEKWQILLKLLDKIELDYSYYEKGILSKKEFEDRLFSNFIKARILSRSWEKKNGKSEKIE